MTEEQQLFLPCQLFHHLLLGIDVAKEEEEILETETCFVWQNCRRRTYLLLWEEIYFFDEEGKVIDDIYGHHCRERDADLEI